VLAEGNGLGPGRGGEGRGDVDSGNESWGAHHSFVSTAKKVGIIRTLGLGEVKLLGGREEV